MEERTELICDLLLGAAYADQDFHEREKEVIIELMGKVLEGEVPDPIKARIDHFDPTDLDLMETAKGFSNQSDDEKLKLLELIGAVHDADDEFSFEEDDYIRQVSGALGLANEKLVGLTVEYEVEELRDSFKKLAAPPPVPA